MAPPLVGNFMGCHLLHESVEFTVDVSEQQPSLGRVRIGRDRKIDQVRPGLSEKEIGLLGDVDVIIGAPAEVMTAVRHRNVACQAILSSNNPKSCSRLSHPASRSSYSRHS